MEAMDPQQPPNSTAPQRKSRRRALKWIGGIMLFGIVALAAAALWPEPASTGPDFAWLPVKPVYIWKPPNAMTRLKFRVAAWLGPLAHRFSRRRAGVTINAFVFSADVQRVEPLVITDSPLGTNTDGSRAWLISTNGVAAFTRKQFALNSTTIGAGSIRTADGIGAGLVSGHFAFDVVPRVAPYTVRLRFSATLTEAMTPKPMVEGKLIVVTNLALSCEVAVPNRGGVLLENGLSGGGSNLWLLVTASATDSKGNPLP